jgi:hypothetical protein
MFIKNDTVYTVAARCCLGGGMTPSDVESLAQTGSRAAFAASLNADMLVGEEEVNGVKANHYQVVGPHGAVDIWMSQEGGYVVRLVGPGRSTR